MEKASVDFNLEELLEYSMDGGFEKTGVIIMKAPNMNVFEEFSKLSQLCMRAISDIQNHQKNISGEDIAKAKALINEKKNSEESMKPDEVKMMLFSSSSVDFIEIANTFKRLAVKVCYVAEDKPIKPVHFDKLQLGDFVNMICTYIANFITPSLL